MFASLSNFFAAEENDILTNTLSLSQYPVWLWVMSDDRCSYAGSGVRFNFFFFLLWLVLLFIPHYHLAVGFSFWKGSLPLRVLSIAQQLPCLHFSWGGGAECGHQDALPAVADVAVCADACLQRWGASILHSLAPPSIPCLSLVPSLLPLWSFCEELLPLIHFCVFGRPS